MLPARPPERAASIASDESGSGGGSTRVRGSRPRRLRLLVERQHLHRPPPRPAPRAPRPAGGSPRRAPARPAPARRRRSTSTRPRSSPRPLPGAPVRTGTVQIAMRNVSIAPNAIRVKAGTTVKWTNYDPLQYNVTSVSGPQQVRSGNFGRGGSFQVVLSKPGRHALRVHQLPDDDERHDRNRRLRGARRRGPPGARSRCCAAARVPAQRCGPRAAAQNSARPEWVVEGVA